MPLSISLSAAIDAGRTSWTLTDQTVFGGSNPARNAYRVYVNAYKVDYQNGKEKLLVDNSSPDTTTEWTIPYTVDGHYQVAYVALLQYDVGTTYARNAAVWSGTSVYRSTVDGNVGQDVANTSFWELIQDPATLAFNKGESNESANIDSFVYNRVFVANGQFYFGKFISDACACSDCDQDEQLSEYNLLSMWIREAQIADQRTEVVDGEIICRRIQSKYAI